MRKISKCLTALALSGVLSISALAGTAQAKSETPADANLPIEAAGVERGAQTGCCPNSMFILMFEYEEFRNPTPMVHDVILIREGKCDICGAYMIFDDKIGTEEHTYDIYDMENKRRYCVCGEYVTWVSDPVEPEEPGVMPLDDRDKKDEIDS